MEYFELYVYPVLVLTGLLAGVINALAGNGSALTLSALILFGMPATIANATNRIGVFFLAVTVILSVKRTPATLRLYRANAGLIVPALVGSALGAYGATLVDDDLLKFVAVGALVLVLMSMLLQGSKWERGDKTPTAGDNISSLVAIFLAGLYAGFIQMGVGIIILASLVMLAKYSFMQANLLKQIITFTLAAVPLIIFMGADMIDWPTGLALGVGQVAGGRIAAKWVLQEPKAQVYIRRLVLVIILFALVGLLDLHNYVLEAVFKA